MEAENEVFELCRSVYEATGWTGTNQVIGIYYQISEVDVKYGIFDRSEKRNEPVDTPLYTSDYLLEKLPKSYKTSLFKLYRSVQNTWWAGYAPLLEIKDDTPLKALLRLTLKLHEKEIL